MCEQCYGGNIGQHEETAPGAVGFLVLGGLVALITSGVLSNIRKGTALGDLGIIKKCRVIDRTSRRPVKDQRWCLWDSKGKRILGRHPSREKALKQERLIQLRKRGLI